MGIGLVIVAITALLLLIKNWRAKKRWHFLYLLLIVAAATAWYFIPYREDLTAQFDTSSMSITVENGTTQKRITDNTEKAYVVEILSEVECQRGWTLWLDWFTPVEAKDRIVVMIYDNEGHFVCVLLNKARPSHSAVYLVDASYRVIFNARELIERLEKQF